MPTWYWLPQKKIGKGQKLVNKNPQTGNGQTNPVDRQTELREQRDGIFKCSAKFTKNTQKQTAVVIIAAMIEGKDNTNNSNEDDKDENSRRITNAIYLSTLPLFNT